MDHLCLLPKIGEQKAGRLIRQNRRIKKTGLPFSEVEDQPAFATRFDLRQAREGSPTFDDFCREVEGLLGARRGPDSPRSP